MTWTEGLKFWKIHLTNYGCLTSWTSSGFFLEIVCEEEINRTQALEKSSEKNVLCTNYHGRYTVATKRMGGLQCHDDLIIDQMTKVLFVRMGHPHKSCSWTGFVLIHSMNSVTWKSDKKNKVFHKWRSFDVNLHIVICGPSFSKAVLKWK